MTSEYTLFVQARFKFFPTPAESFLHAAIGIAGELIELRNANTRENLIEELGDLEFYWVAMGIVLQQAGAPVSPHLPDEYFSLDGTMSALVDDAVFLLDQAKKGWVYNKPLDLNALSLFHSKVGDLIAHLGRLLDASIGEIQRENMAKLRKRYPDGYSDKAAQERADKEGKE